MFAVQRDQLGIAGGGFVHNDFARADDGFFIGGEEPFTRTDRREGRHEAGRAGDRHDDGVSVSQRGHLIEASAPEQELLAGETRHELAGLLAQADITGAELGRDLCETFLVAPPTHTHKFETIPMRPEDVERRAAYRAGRP